LDRHSGPLKFTLTGELSGPFGLQRGNIVSTMATKAKAKAKTIRSANPEAVRVTVYFPPGLHARLTKRMLADRIKARKLSTGPRTVKRVTLSDTTIRAVESYLS